MFGSAHSGDKLYGAFHLLLTCRRQREVCCLFKGGQGLTSMCSLILPLQFSFPIASYRLETDRFQDQAWCAACVYDQDIAASRFLLGDSQPLPHYWLDFLGRVLEQMQTTYTRGHRPGWIWIQWERAHREQSTRCCQWLSVRSTSCKSHLCPCSMS